MAHGASITDISTLAEEGSHLFTVEDRFGNDREAILVPCDEEPGVRGWINNCPHEDQRFDRGTGVPMRNGEIICPKHGSLFDACSGGCGNGPAAGTTLPSVDVDVADGSVVLTDDGYTYSHDGEAEDDDEGPSSTSHLSF